DIGCGKGEALIRLGERYGASGVGLDVNPEFLKIAEREAIRRFPSNKIAFQLTEATSFSAPPDAYSAAICLGSTHAYGSFRSALESLSRLVRPAGGILIGEGYWRREPDPGYQHLLGAERDELNDHAGNIAQGVAIGLTPLMNRESSLAEWDAYEALYAQTVEEYLEANPDDPDAAELRDRVRSWRDGYLRWGRGTLGFATYLFRKPIQPAP
ncbi:MAG TPA: class I SAM-dependent methyltransferase, partial [Candidatus Eisenbacteria bacterium]|nr:class I SAM-dependent methyltransferase [Candidatus Eisenbacteria bacterium]